MDEYDEECDEVETAMPPLEFDEDVIRIPFAFRLAFYLGGAALAVTTVWTIITLTVLTGCP